MANKKTKMPERFENSDIQFAYSSIHNFFDVCGLDHAIKYTNSILEAATGYKVWRKEVPSSLLFYMENFTSLFAAVFTIHYSYGRRNDAIIAEPEDGVPDFSVNQNFMAEGFYMSSIWNNFPRHLTASQYHNPYKAIKKFCTYMAEPEWKELLKNVTEFALSKEPFDDTYHSYNMLTVHLRMMQLIEACHLLEIRTNRKKATSTKNKKKKKQPK